MLDQCGEVPFLHGVGMKDFDLLKVLGTGGKYIVRYRVADK